MTDEAQITAPPTIAPETGSSASVSKSLSEALEAPTTLTLDGEVRRSTWKPPASVSNEMRTEAAALVAKIDAAMGLCPQDDVRDWLTSLGALVAANITVADARARLTAYVGMLEYPSACYTKASLRKAARRFKFFPTYGELTDFLDAQLAEIRTKRQRLQAIINAAAGQRQIEAPKRQTVEERQRIGALFGRLRQAMETGDYGDLLAGADVRRSTEQAPSGLPSVETGEGGEAPERMDVARRVAAETAGFRKVPKPWERKIQQGAA